MKKLTEIIAGIILSSATCMSLGCSKSESQQIIEEATKYYEESKLIKSEERKKQLISEWEEQIKAMKYCQEKGIIKSEEEKRKYLSEGVYRELIESNESAIKYIMRSLITKASIYQIKYGERCPPLEELVKKGLISEDLLSGEIKGYKIENITYYMWNDKNYPEKAYKATPLEQGKTGINSYFVDAGGVIRKADNPNVNQLSEPDPTAPHPPGM